MLWVIVLVTVKRKKVWHIPFVYLTTNSIITSANTAVQSIISVPSLLNTFQHVEGERSWDGDSQSYLDTPAVPQLPITASANRNLVHGV